MGSYVYAARSYGLTILDISTPTAPVKVEHFDDCGPLADVYVSGNYAYTSSFSNGLEIIDISDPTNPNHVGRFDDGGMAHGVCVSGSYAYIADGFDGLEIFHISDKIVDPFVRAIIIIIGIYSLVVISVFYAKFRINNPRKKSSRYTTLKTPMSNTFQDSRPARREITIKIGNMDALKKDIEEMLSWSSWSVSEEQGTNKRIRNAHPTDDFWKIWHNAKKPIKKLGFTISKKYDQWQVSQWETLHFYNYA